MRKGIAVMTMDLLPPDVVWRAIEVYLRCAYDGPPPAHVRPRLDALRAAGPGEFWASKAFEHEGSRYSLRLGNRYYPHMKMVVEPSPRGDRWLFRADTHDAHACPTPDAIDYAEFRDLMERNRVVATAIEDAWTADGITTFRQYLREDLARRRAAEG